MSNDLPNVIGEGTYGCVHNPPLLCKDSSERDLKNVSKLMATEEAVSEMKEYVLINNIDKNKDYYLGQPTQCSVGKVKSNRLAIRECKISEQVFDDYSNYSLLIMKNGGLNLDQYAKKMEKEVINSENKQKIEDFWLETHRLMMGLKLLYDNDVVHHDMKSGNIVYIEKENRLNFIDFGLMNKKSSLMSANRKDDNWLTMAHWSFPLELEYLGYSAFLKMSGKSQSVKTQFVSSISTDISKTKPSMKISQALQAFFSIVNTKRDIFQLNSLSKYLEDYLLTLKDIDNKKKYEKFMEHTVNTIDSYGVATGLMIVLSSVYKFMDMEFVYELADILYKMFTPHPIYENCLERHILKKQKLQFKEHKIVKETKIETVFNKKIGSIKLKDIIITSKKKLSELASSPKCPDGKELNPYTRRCVKICKNGYARDKQFKCKRKTLKQYDCPEGKVLNPKTNRCINIKHTRKICPERKVLNTKTGRCIKIKKAVTLRR